MKKILATLVAGLLISGSAMADTGWLGSFVYLNDGGGDTYYDLNEATANPDFTGNLGTFNLGYTLWLNAEINAWADSGDVFSTFRAHYSINGGAFQTLTVNQGDIFNTGGNNWRGLAMGGDLAGLGVGDHTIDVYLSRTHSWDGGSYTTYLITTGDIGGGVDPGSTPPSGDFFSATFTVVPEPGTIALFGIGLAGLMVARRRRA
ncbi:MAG TPA: PEP-CTERM sorting domain-containing protein [Kiritimatiellia bacterium]|nr:PEP-CTERM sorting domain-containing protein [Kiritimatiellia bacterium]